MRNCVKTNPRETSMLLDKVVAGLRSQHVQRPMIFCMMRLIAAMSHTHFVRRCVADLGPCANLLCFTGQKGRSKRSRAVIVRFCLCSCDQKLYMTCICPCARCFCIRAPEKDIDFVSLGAVFLVLGCTCNTNLIMARAWMV